MGKTMIIVSRISGRWAVVCALLLVSWLQMGCRTGGSATQYTDGPAAATGAPMASVNPAAGNGAQSSGSGSESIDALHVGDVLTIEFSDMPLIMTPREERIKEDGTITLLEGKTFVAAGKTRGQLEREVHDWYVPRFYLKMTVSIRQLKDTQFYYVRGEVRLPNRQVYISRIKLLQAIASAGDFTDFARKKDVLLTRADGRKIRINCVKALNDPELNLEIMPGDIIYVPRRNPIW
jgi:protein involved in polysaccharide export with SLBB domain